MTLTQMCAVVCGHSLKGVPIRDYPEGLLPTRVGNHPTLRAGRNEPQLPAPLFFNLMLPFCLGWDHSTGSGSTSSFTPSTQRSALSLEGPSHQSWLLDSFPSSLPPRLLFPGAPSTIFFPYSYYPDQCLPQRLSIQCSLESYPGLSIFP